MLRCEGVLFRGFPLVVVNNFTAQTFGRALSPLFAFYLYFYIYWVCIFKTKWRTPFRRVLSAIAGHLHTIDRPPTSSGSSITENKIILNFSVEIC